MEYLWMFKLMKMIMKYNYHINIRMGFFFSNFVFYSLYKNSNFKIIVYFTPNKVNSMLNIQIMNDDYSIIYFYEFTIILNL